MKKLINIIKMIHRLVYCLALPIGAVLYIVSIILYYIIMMFVPFIIYIYNGNFYTECIQDIDEDDHIINKTFTKLNNFIYPKYK